MSHEGQLGIQTQKTRRCTGRDDDGLGKVLSKIGLQFEGTLTEIDLGDFLELDAGSKALSLGLQLFHHLGAHDALGIAWKILNVRCDRKLTTRLHTLKQERLQVGAGGINRRGIASRAGANNDYFVHVSHCLSEIARGGVRGVGRAGSLIDRQHNLTSPFGHKSEHALDLWP